MSVAGGRIPVTSWQQKEVRKRRNEEMKSFTSLRVYYRIVNAFAVNLTIMKITNHKSQITNKSQSPNYKLQNKEAPFGHICNAFGEKNTRALLSRPGHLLFGPCGFGHCILEFVCDLYFVIWNFQPKALSFLAGSRS
jgi:hypothetical protein